MQIYFMYEKDYAKALVLADNLHTRFPNNMLFHKYLGRCYVSVNNWQTAEQVFTEILNRVRTHQRGYTTSAEREAEYYLGMNDMNMRRYELALPHFYRCDELSRNLDREEPSGFMVMTNLKVGMIYDAQAKRDLAIMQYKKVLSMKEFKDSYKQAEQFLNTPYVQ
jgi:tetratricopeptide (TPR) repeat protein